MNVMQQERVRTALLSLDGIGGAIGGEGLGGVEYDLTVSDCNGRVELDVEMSEYVVGPDNQYITMSPSAALNLAVSLLRVLAAMESEVAL
jgi:hypothetical protein